MWWRWLLLIICVHWAQFDNILDIMVCTSCPAHLYYWFRRHYQYFARFEPVAFDEEVIAMVESAAAARGLSVMRLPSAAGHDAQMLARLCPTAMVFTPSVRGISHNPAEFTSPDDLVEGCQVLADVMLQLAVQ